MNTRTPLFHQTFNSFCEVNGVRRRNQRVTQYRNKYHSLSISLAIPETLMVIVFSSKSFVASFVIKLLKLILSQNVISLNIRAESVCGANVRVVTPQRRLSV